MEIFFLISRILWNFQADKSGLLFFYQSYQRCFHFFRGSTIVIIGVFICSDLYRIPDYTALETAFLRCTRLSASNIVQGGQTIDSVFLLLTHFGFFMLQMAKEKRNPQFGKPCTITASGVFEKCCPFKLLFQQQTFLCTQLSWEAKV